MEEVLHSRQIDEFVATGMCVLRGACSRAAAQSLEESVWRSLEAGSAVRRHEARTWPGGYFYHRMEPNAEARACLTPRLEAAITQLIGTFTQAELPWNFPVNFPVTEQPPREFPLGGWHIDGSWKNETLDRLEMHLLVVGLVTDIEPGFGGTVFALGSHQRSARLIADPGTNRSRVDLFKSLLQEPIGNFHEIVGCAGDAVLAHPFLLHTTGFNRIGPPRIISALRLRALSPLRLSATAQQPSALELSIRRALNEPPVAPAGAMLCKPMLD